MVEPHSSNVRVITTNFWGVRIFRTFTVHYQRFTSKSLFKVWTKRCLHHQSVSKCLIALSRFWREILITKSYFLENRSYGWAVLRFVICISCYMVIRRLGTRQKSLWTYHATSQQELTQLILQFLLFFFSFYFFIFYFFVPNVYVNLFTFTRINFISGFWLANSHQSPSKCYWK